MCEPFTAAFAASSAAAAATGAAATTAAATAATTAAAGGWMGALGSAMGTAWGSAGWGTALSLAGAGLNYYQTDQQADAQADAIKTNNNTQQAQMRLQQEQVNQQATDKMSQVALDALRETGRLRAVAGDVGLEGVSTDRLARDIRMSEGTDIATLESNRIKAGQQLGMEAHALRAQSQSKLNSIKQPSLLGVGLQIAGGLADDSRRGSLRKAGYSNVY